MIHNYAHEVTDSCGHFSRNVGHFKFFTMVSQLGMYVVLQSKLLEIQTLY